MMKKLSTLALTLAAALSLTGVAHADVVSVPEMAGDLLWENFPIVLVVAVMVVTVILLRKFRK